MRRGGDGVDRAAHVRPGADRSCTLYTILGSFLDAGLITETETEGRRRTYAISGEGERRYAEELMRLRQCVADAERKGDTCAENGALPILQAGI